MKKKALIALFVVLMACLLSLTVSAANEVTLKNGTTADLTTVFKVNSNNQITGFNTGYSKDDVTDVIFPDEIEGLEANFLFGSAVNLNTVTFAATDTFFISGDNIFSSSSVKTITFNPDCVVELRKGNFSGCKSLTQITFPKFKKLSGSAFASCSNMVSTNELVFAEGMTEIGGHAFNGCKSLRGTVYFPSTLEKIYEYSFQNTGFDYFDLSKCAKLTSVGGGYGGPFPDNDNITKLDMSGCTSLTKLEKGSLASGCDNLVEVILPPNLENISHKAFAHCYKLQYIVFPASMQTVDSEAFHSARRDQEIKTFTVYLQSNVQFHATNSSFRDSSAKIEYVLIGEGVTAESFLAVNSHTVVTGATVVDYLNPDSPWTYTPSGVLSTNTIVENYCKSLALSGNHLSNANPCVINCSDCGLSKAVENPIHSEAFSIVYANGFNNEGTRVTACTNEGCAHKVTEKALALFVSNGFSLQEKGGDGIVVGYIVNKNALSEYESVNNTTVNYGVFVVSQKNLGENDIFGQDGKAADGVVSVDLTGRKFDVFELKLKGFDEENKDAKLSFGAFVKVANEEGTSYSYMQIEKPENGEKYFFISYNEMLKNN